MFQHGAVHQSNNETPNDIYGERGKREVHAFNDHTGAIAKHGSQKAAQARDEKVANHLLNGLISGEGVFEVNPPFALRLYHFQILVFFPE